MQINAPISARTQPNHSMPSVRPAGLPRGYKPITASDRPGTNNATSVAGLAALAYASDAAAFLTEAYVHPGPRMPPPETGRDDLAPGLAHAIVAVLIYALLARRRRCCESKQRSGKRE